MTAGPPRRVGKGGESVSPEALSIMREFRDRGSGTLGMSVPWPWCEERAWAELTKVGYIHWAACTPGLTAAGYGWLNSPEGQALASSLVPARG